MTDKPDDAQPLMAGTMTPETMSLDKIDSKWDLQVRRVDPKHVADLLTSIRDQGLLEPLVVDQDDVLIAGNHRYAAIVQLKEGSPVEFRRWFPRSQVPVSRLPFKASKHVQEAIAASVAENQKRQDLDPQSVKEYRDKLAKEYKLTVGRPKKGETAVMTVLAQAFQRSPRYLREVLAKAKGQKKPGGDRLVPRDVIPEAMCLPKGVTVADFKKMKVLDRAKQILVAMKLTDAELQDLSTWCLLRRTQRNASVKAKE